MYSSLTLLLSAVVLVAAQSIPNIPQCSLNCFTTALTSDGCNGITDFACHCQKQSLATQLTACVQKACPPSDQQAVLATVQDTCKQAGHPITVAIPSTSAAGGGSSSATSAAETSSSEAQTTQATSTGATSPTSDSVSGSFGSMMPSNTATGESGGSSSSSGAGGAGGVGTTAAPPTGASPSSFTGAANANALGNVSGLTAVAIALLSWLM